MLQAIVKIGEARGIDIVVCNSDDRQIAKQEIIDMGLRLQKKIEFVCFGIVCLLRKEPMALYHKYRDEVIKEIDGGGGIKIFEMQSYVTGWYKGDILPGDGIVFSKEAFPHIITEIKERRDHSGIFDNPEDKTNSYFNVVCTFRKIVLPKTKD